MSLSHSPLIVRDGLVLCLDAANPRSYPKSGTTWSDLAGANNGTLTNMTDNFNQDDKGSLSFDGSNEYVTFDTQALPSTITVELWVILDTITGVHDNSFLMGHENSSNGSYRINYSNTSISWACCTTNNSWYSTGTSITSSSFSTGSKIYHVVGTYDGSNNKIYIDGVLHGTGANISGNIKSATGNYTLSKPAATNLNYFKGRIYSNRRYSRALTASEVLQNYNATRGRYGI
jgi:hypothetical protein